MFCSNCGSQLSDTAKFCTNCGTPVAAKAAPAEPVYAPPAEPAYTPPTAPAEPAYTPPTAPAEPAYTPPTAPAEPVYTYAPPQSAPVYIPTEPFPPAPKKKSGKGVLIAVIAAVLALAIGVGIFLAALPSGAQKTYRQAVALYEAGSYEEALALFDSIDYEDSERYAERCRRKLQAAEPAPTTPATLPPVETTEPTEPPVTVELVVEDAELVYELTDADVENFYTLLEVGEALALSSTDSDEVDAAFDAVDEAYEYLETQYGIAMVLYYCDLNDEEASQLYLDCTDIATQANDAYMQSARRIYLAETPHNDILFEGWTEEELQMLVRYTDEIPKLEKRNAEIEVAYQGLQDSDTMYDDMVPLYIEMVQNKNRIAQIYGYDNFYTYAYSQVYGRDYGSEEIALMRSYARAYLPEAMESAMTRFTEGMEELGYSDQLRLSGLLFNDFAQNEGYLTDYLATLPEGTRSDMLDMFNGNILRMNTTEGAMEGAFTTNLTEDRSICFFGPDYSNVLTVIHEVGHYYGSKHADLDELPMDLAETQSQGNEWLFIGHLLSKDSSKLNNSLRDYKLYNDLVTIAICVIVDEFEERVYTHPNIASLTGDDLDALMAEVCQQYGGIAFLSTVATDIQNYWRLVVVEQPVYYISYGVSAIAAMNVYTIAEEDYDAGVAAYVSVIEGIDPDEGFLTNITRAGLDGPFDEDVYIAIAEMFN